MAVCLFKAPWSRDIRLLEWPFYYYIEGTIDYKLTTLDLYQHVLHKMFVKLMLDCLNEIECWVKVVFWAITKAKYVYI